MKINWSILSSSLVHFTPPCAPSLGLLVFSYLWLRSPFPPKVQLTYPVPTVMSMSKTGLERRSEMEVLPTCLIENIEIPVRIPSRWAR